MKTIGKMIIDGITVEPTDLTGLPDDKTHYTPWMECTIRVNDVREVNQYIGNKNVDIEMTTKDGSKVICPDADEVGDGIIKDGTVKLRYESKTVKEDKKCQNEGKK